MYQSVLLQMQLPHELLLPVPFSHLLARLTDGTLFAKQIELFLLDIHHTMLITEIFFLLQLRQFLVGLLLQMFCVCCFFLVLIPPILYISLPLLLLHHALFLQFAHVFNVLPFHDATLLSYAR